MPKLRLCYFDFDGGRGEAARLALAIGNVNFEDDRVTSETWPQVKSKQPFGALPVLYVDDVPLAQSNAICRYVGRLTDTYPSDPWQAAICDQVMDTVEELTVKIGSTIALSDEEKKTKRLALVESEIPLFLSGLENILKKNGGVFFASERLTVADLRTYDLVQWLKSGILDHIPADLTDRVAPLLCKHMETIKNEPRIKAYYDSRKK